MIGSKFVLGRCQVNIVFLHAIVGEMLFLVTFSTNRLQCLTGQEPGQYQQTIIVQRCTARCAKLIVIERILLEIYDLAKFFVHSENPFNFAGCQSNAGFALYSPISSFQSASFS